MSNRSKQLSAGKANPVITVLLSGILVALIVLIVVVVRNSGPGPDETTVKPKPDENTVSKPIDDPDRIKETLQEGKTYRVILKVSINSRAEDKDWGVKQVTNLAYVGEMAMNRTIEQNNGRRIVELRHFETARNVKLLSDVEDVTIELGAPGMLVLAALETFAPGAGQATLAAKPIAEAILKGGAEVLAENVAGKAFANIDSLSGKKVRITYVDGVGVEGIEAVGCTLSPDERDWIAATAVLSDYHLFPELEIEVGGTWTVDGKEFTGFIDPSLRGVTSGEITIKRTSNQPQGGKQYAELAIEDGYLSIDRSDDASKRVGTFTPRGTIHYSLTNRIVETASLTGDITIEEVSQDHLLFEASHKVQPKVNVSYSCQIQ